MGAGPFGEAAGDRAGSAVSLSGDGTRVVVASTGNDGLGVNVDAGAARVYQWMAAPDATSMPPPSTSIAFPDGSSSAAGLPTPLRQTRAHHLRRLLRYRRRGVSSGRT